MFLISLMFDIKYFQLKNLILFVLVEFSLLADYTQLVLSKVGGGLFLNRFN